MKILVILFEYLQSISGENFPPNTWTIITCMKQRMHLLTIHSIYMFLEKKKEKRMKVAVLQVYGISHFPPLSILFINYLCEGNLFF